MPGHDQKIVVEDAVFGVVVNVVVLTVACKKDINISFNLWRIKLEMRLTLAGTVVGANVTVLVVVLVLVLVVVVVMVITHLVTVTVLVAMPRVSQPGHDLIGEFDDDDGGEEEQKTLRVTDVVICENEMDGGIKTVSVSVLVSASRAVMVIVARMVAVTVSRAVAITRWVAVTVWRGRVMVTVAVVLQSSEARTVEKMEKTRI